MWILIADDHTLVRELLAEALLKIEVIGDDMKISHADTADKVLAFSGTEPKPNIILLDLNMPGSNGVQTVKEIVDRFPMSRILCISGVADPRTARQCIAEGAAGFIPKTTSGQSLRNAIKVILDGEIYVHSHALKEIATTPHREQHQTEDKTIQNALPAFSPRETQIIESLIAGNSNKDISRLLDLQEMTVKTHLRNIYRKLGAQNRASAVSIVLQARHKS
jgi:two-component system nitrate/nitrite response regulator NarL